MPDKEYSPHKWSSGEKITAARLNAMEMGIAGAVSKDADKQFEIIRQGKNMYLRAYDVDTGKKCTVMLEPNTLNYCLSSIYSEGHGENYSTFITGASLLDTGAYATISAADVEGASEILVNSQNGITFKTKEQEITLAEIVAKITALKIKGCEINITGNVVDGTLTLSDDSTVPINGTYNGN